MDQFNKARSTTQALYGCVPLVAMAHAYVDLFEMMSASFALCWIFSYLPLVECFRLCGDHRNLVALWGCALPHRRCMAQIERIIELDLDRSVWCVCVYSFFFLLYANVARHTPKTPITAHQHRQIAHSASIYRVHIAERVCTSTTHIRTYRYISLKQSAKSVLCTIIVSDVCLISNRIFF